MDNVSITIDGVLTDCTVTTASNGDYVITAPSGRFVKLPSDGGALADQVAQWLIDNPVTPTE